MKHLRESEPSAAKLATLLDIAEQQRELLSRGDLDAVQELQSRRQHLLDGIQSLGKGDRDENGAVSKILELDQEMVCLLLSEAVDIQEKMLKITSLRKLLRSRPHAGKRPARHLSRHI